ncbi:DUF1566 domain-containing protein [Neptunicella marina]|uniref:DUF1566 domain-containing protein n=1 Tax=Neptunicella marina TaxID=2125989 RepID=A0A8J6IS46_9ALTE|nr:DUF1566 domain-containing protein [Neptunicella marina]MBC3766450.1 DUF1566 domain-containing protein [Neptunicella marina]
MLRLYFVSFILFSLLACSGEDTLSTAPVEQPPKPAVSITLPDDFSANENSLVALTGSARGQTTELTYAWSLTPALDIAHDDTTMAAASFTAPQTTVPVDYIASLTVTDGLGNAATDSVMITIQPVNTLPTPVIVANQHANYASLQFPAGSAIVLDGTSSFDTDAVDINNPITEWRWSQTAGSDITQGKSLDGEILRLTAPIADPGESMTFSLTVTDGEGGQNTAQVTIAVVAASDTLPTVYAGENVTVTSGENILLLGQADTVNPDAMPLSYRWLNDSQLAPSIVSENTLATYAVAPSVTESSTATFTLQVTDALGNKVEDSLDVKVVPQVLSRLNDTGVILHSDGSAQVNSQALVAQYPNQDADNGRDAIAKNGNQPKAGEGDKGFDFTKLDLYGDELPDNATTWRCVRDNVTGLIWEVKQASAGLGFYQHSFSWYQQENNGGIDGALNGAASNCNLAQCNTTDYVLAVNNAGVCGFYDWRLPSHNELVSILHLGKTTAPLIDSNYFPFATSGLTAPVWYWTSEPSADGVSNDESQNAWVVDFATGNDNFINKGSAAHIRLVRAGR